MTELVRIASGGHLSSAFGWGLRNRPEVPFRDPFQLKQKMGDGHAWEAIELRHQESSGWFRIMVLLGLGSGHTLFWWHGHAKALGHKE